MSARFRFPLKQCRDLTTSKPNEKLFGNTPYICDIWRVRLRFGQAKWGRIYILYICYPFYRDVAVGQSWDQI